MSNTYHFIGIKGAGMSALALMLHQMGHTVQGSYVEKYYFTQRGLEQAGIQIYPFDVKNLEGDKILIAGNAFRPDNNVEIAYADEHGLTYKRYHELVNLCVTSSAWGLPEHTEKPQQQGCFLTSYQISLIPVI